MINFNDA
jgi:hypothetical protein